ncbi:MAG: site-specific integrase, partial [Nitrosotalea sp.]
MDKSLTVFDKYCKSEITKSNYQYQFSKFLKWTKIKEGDGILQLRESALQEMIEDYIYSLRHRVSPNSYSGVVASLQLFFSMNDKVLNWDKIYRLIPSSVAKSGKDAWTNVDITKMLESTTSLRNRAIIHFLTSTGCRLGAIPELRSKHIENLQDGFKAVLIYAGAKEEYYAFLTSESGRILDEYLEKRKRDGEYLNEDSPVFREEYQVGIQKVIPLTYDAVAYMLYRIVKKIQRKRTGHRFNVQMAHGFRKRYASIIKMDNTISWAVSERLLGHKSYLDEEYFRPTRDNLFKEFLKIQQHLILDDGERERVRRIEA